MILDGKKIAEEIHGGMRKKMKQADVQPGLAAILIGDDPSSRIYVDMKGRVATSLGFYFEKIHLKKNASSQEVIDVVRRCNTNRKIHGFLLQIPLPKHLSLSEIIQYMDPQKDIDCLHPTTFARLASGEISICPPTAEAVIQLITTSGIQIQGANIVVIGDGFFGRQIALRAMNLKATVTLANSKTQKLIQLTKKADVVITALGKPRFLTASYIKKGAVVIDVGITKEGRSVVGDVDFISVSKKAGAITPVPGGVGPITVALLMKNVLDKALTKKS